MYSRSELARDFYVAMGYTPAQAAGIVGNFIQESGPGLDTGASGDQGTALGIGQWRGKRLDRLKAFAEEQGKPVEDFETQLRFADYELKNHETKAYKQLQAAKTVPDATAAMISYERPQGWTANNPQGGHGWENRLEHAMALVGGSASPQGDTGTAAASPGPTLNQVLGQGQDQPSTAPAGRNPLASIDFAALFTPPDMPELPPLPPIPDPIPLGPQEPLYRPPQYASLQPQLPGLRRPGGGLPSA